MTKALDIPNESIKLRALDIQGFRILRHVTLGDLGDINILAGRNNSGKSSILNVLRLPKSLLTEFGQNNCDTKELQDIQIVLDLEFIGDQKLCNDLLLGRRRFQYIYGFKGSTLRLDDARFQAAETFTSFIQPSEANAGYLPAKCIKDGLQPPENLPRAGWSKNMLDEHGSGGETKTINNLLRPAQHLLANLFALDPMRRSKRSPVAVPTTNLEQDGSNLALVLLALQSNEPYKFDELRGSVEEILPDLGRLAVELLEKQYGDGPKVYAEIRFHGKQEKRPLDVLGTGVEQILFALTALKVAPLGALICLEEPENNLHPSAQRFLMHKLRESGRQFLITTHSPTIIDTPDARVFRLVAGQDGFTEVRAVETKLDQSLTCQDLGIRPSDLVQTNFIIWVEGPSDRIYLKRWIEIVDNDLQEGRHYTFLLYGGRLFTHLTGEDPGEGEDERKQLISIVHTCRNSAFVMDNDCKKADSRLYKVQQTLKSELEKQECLCWVTAGREIENYIPIETLKKVVPLVHTQSEYKPVNQKRGRLTRIKGPRAKKAIDFDKVKVAKAVMEHLKDDLPDSGLDLEKRLKDLVAAIRRANDI